MMRNKKWYSLAQWIQSKQDKWYDPDFDTKYEPMRLTLAYHEKIMRPKPKKKKSVKVIGEELGSTVLLETGLVYTYEYDGDKYYWTDHGKFKL